MLIWSITPFGLKDCVKEYEAFKTLDLTSLVKIFCALA